MLSTRYVFQEEWFTLMSKLLITLTKLWGEICNRNVFLVWFFIVWNEVTRSLAVTVMTTIYMLRMISLIVVYKNSHLKLISKIVILNAIFSPVNCGSNANFVSAVPGKWYHFYNNSIAISVSVLVSWESNHLIHSRYRWMLKFRFLHIYLYGVLQDISKLEIGPTSKHAYACILDTVRSRTMSAWA